MSVSDYQDDTLPGIPDADMDALRLRDILQEGRVGGFDEVESVVNGDYARSATALSALFSGRSPDDLLLLHIVARIARNGSSHSLHFLLSDSQPNDPAGTAIDAAWLTRQIARCRCKQIVVLVDGSSDGKPSTIVTDSSALSLRSGVSAFPPFGRALIVSEAVGVVATPIPHRQSSRSFTSTICNGLSSGQADVDGDGRVTVRDLYAYLKEELLLCTPTQTPLLQTNGAESDNLLIASNPFLVPPAPQVADLPPQIRDLTNSDRVDRRLAAVAQLKALMQSADPSMRNSAVIALHGMCDDDSRRVAQAASSAFAPWGSIGGGDSLLGRTVSDAPNRPFQQFVLITHSEVTLSQQGGSWVGGDQAGGDINKQHAGGDIVGASAGRGNVSTGATKASTVNSVDALRDALTTLNEQVSSAQIGIDDKIAALSALKWFNEHIEDSEAPSDLDEQTSKLRAVGGWIWDKFAEIITDLPAAGLAAWVYEFSKTIIGG